jgi:hypothetical protein
MIGRGIATGAGTITGGTITGAGTIIGGGTATVTITEYAAT